MVYLQVHQVFCVSLYVLRGKITHVVSDERRESFIGFLQGGRLPLL
ncbi:hypothetical protein KDX38_11865 [Pseudomonas sp. CDFA 602]|nr:hypothetical protein [Pseudomonas californiensis]MCD5994379.1 hypothetical protein [Pseudomonas californiensis]MCD5999913.1 hypothetical protein [Pseudomonas californiensis]